ncbi:YIP1 family protein [Shewanella avicenniae]|uniref:YIP1 family protein n=1 Tax=Shewanella avicenniae TaxID=2814294 RepID=A0ABX7QLF4_9GAMM|nr:Yip1 family protein [Shewanella avicenniae]QSX32214.1 YIP1 family protein [Shewanella avicenniae]
MSNHIIGLILHPGKEWQQINSEHESVSHLYYHHILGMAAIPVVASFIGTTQFGWSFGGDESYKVSIENGIALGLAFYALMLAAVWIVGSLIHWLAREYPERPSRGECVVFAGYTATPMFLAGAVAIYPVFWVCLLALSAALGYTAYLLYKGTPRFLGISHDNGFIISGMTLGWGILLLEVMLTVVVMLWSMSSETSIMWSVFK